jgi:hypothetical protein
MVFISAQSFNGYHCWGGGILQRKIDPNGRSLFLAHLTKSSCSFFNPKLNCANIFIVGKTVGETDTLVHCW